MRIIFFGSGKIAVPCLEFLVKEKYDILVVTSPDKQKGRHLLTSATPVKEFALKQNLSIFQPNNPSFSDSIEFLRTLKPDIFIVFSFGKILSKDLLNLTQIFPLNIHASLLPKYRGAAPINWALINGENKIGITVIKMSEGIDGGDMVLQKEIEIDNLDNAMTLQDKLASLAVTALAETLDNIKNKKTNFLKQDDSKASFAPKLKKEDGKIDWNKKAEQINNQIRGCFSWPGAFTFYKNSMIKILRAEVIDINIEHKYKPGVIVNFDKNGIIVATQQNNKALLIKELQPSSGKKLTAWQFIQGHKIDKNDKFS